MALFLLWKKEGGVLTYALPFLAPFLTVTSPHRIHSLDFSSCSQMLKKALLSCNHAGF